MKALILAGGKGTRLKELTAAVPKALVPIAGKPVIEYQLELLRRQGLVEVVILVNHLGAAIKEHCGDGQKWGLRISYLEEAEPLGTAGGIRALAAELTEDFLVLYGDLLVNMDLQRFRRRHEDNVAADPATAGTLMVHPNNHPFDSDLVAVDEDTGRITGFMSKPHPPELVYRNLVNAAVYFLTPRIFEYIPTGRAADFGHDVFPAVVRGGRHGLYAYNSPEHLRDMGTPERLAQAEVDVASGYFARGTLAFAKPAVFLDRDGVLNEEVDGVRSAEDFRLLPKAAAAIREINRGGYYAVIVTNQPVVAKGFCEYGDVMEIHKKMETELGQAGAKLDAIYFCAHHPEKGFPGENPIYKVVCTCRKPAIGMIERAAKELNIDLRQSWLIGDTTVDAQTAANAGLRFAGVRTGYGCRDGKFSPAAAGSPLYDDVLAAVFAIVGKC